jgi:hypothetical protein
VYTVHVACVCVSVRSANFYLLRSKETHISGLYIDAVSVSDNLTENGRIINEYNIRRSMEGSGRGRI